MTKLIVSFRNFAKAPKEGVRITTHGLLGYMTNMENSLRPGRVGVSTATLDAP